MQTLTLVRRSLQFYWRTQTAVVLGVATAVAVIAGALIVGDSVRDSLRQMSLDRLGGVDLALTGHRFVREELADQWDETPPLEGASAAPAIVLPGAMTRRLNSAGQSGTPPGETSAAPQLVRAGGVQVYGLDERLWSLLQRTSPGGSDRSGGALTVPTGNQVVLNRRTADQLGAAVGDEVSLVIEIPATIPRDALLGDRDTTVTDLVLEVSGIAEDAATLGRFGLNPSQQLPLNAYVSLLTLQRQIGLQAVPATRRNPVPRPGRINALFFALSRNAEAGASAAATTASDAATQALHEACTLQDLNLRLTPDATQRYLSLESDQMILEDSVAEAAQQAAAELQATTSPVLVYLLNRLGRPDPAGGEAKRGYSMYSVAAGIDFQAPPPFGPFEFVQGGPPTDVTPNGASTTAAIPVVINDWLADDLAGEGGDGRLIEVGAVFPVRYHVVGDRGELPEEEVTFRVAGIVKLAGPAADQGLTPRVEGVTDVESYSDWREPFPLDHNAITPRDDAYWKAHRATPKVFLPLPVAQRLWQSRYGHLTSIRFAPPAGETLEDFAARLTPALLQRLGPQATGLIVQPVKLQGVQAALGTTDFTGLFVGFSCFLIAAAMLLIGLLFQLGVEQRSGELGLLTAIGLTPAQVRRLFATEGTTVSLAGAALGVPAAIGYAGIMIYGLKTWWNRAIGTEFLLLSVRPGSVVMGTVFGVGVALGAILWSLWRTREVSPRNLLQGQMERTAAELSRRRWGTSRQMAWGALGSAAVLLAASLAGAVPGREAFGGLSWQVVAFFVMGILLLAGLLAVLTAWLSSDRATAVAGSGTAALARLGLRNASRCRSRSVLTASLIASAAFLIVAVAAGKRNPQREAPQRNSGNGGFTLVAESSQPILYDLNTPEGRNKLGLGESALPPDVWVAPFRMRPGEDASCLNLYLTQLPTILGIPEDVLDEFDRAGRFKFANTPASHPWRALAQPLADGRIPVLGDLNTLMFSLKKGIGDTVPVPAAALVDSGRTSAELQVVGMTDGSVFQGVLVMSETNFRALFPKIAGFRYFLVETAAAEAPRVSQLLESGLSDQGFDAEPVAVRLANFLAVQNTYLSTFQTLGGLGLLLGTIGLATVMLRNVLERRSEFALLRAVGLRSSQVLQLVLWENAFLLVWGLASGTSAALLAMQPHLRSTGAEVPWGDLTALLAAVLVIGMLAPLAAARAALRPQILAGLRAE